MIKSLKTKRGIILIITLTVIILGAFLAFDIMEKKKAEAIELEKIRVEQEEQKKREEEEERIRVEEEKRKAEQERIRVEEEKRREEEEKKKKEEEELKLQAQQNNTINTSNSIAILKEDLPIKERIEKYMGNEINRLGFIYYDLYSGEKISINENKVFTAASSYKVGMNIITYEEARKGNLSLDEGVSYIPSNDYEGGTGILQGQINTTLSKPVPISKLLELSITHSDNIATRMMNRRLGGTPSVRKRINDLVGLSCDTSSNYTTPEIQYRLLKKLYDNKEDMYYSQLISNLKNTIFNDRLAKYIPNKLVAHKIGNYGGAVNDIGIVFTDKPYIIVIYSQGLTNPYENIARISEMVYYEQLKK